MSIDRTTQESLKPMVAGVIVALIFTAGMVHSAERTVLGEYITADW